MNELTFKSQKIIPVIVNNLPYLTATQVGAALGYSRPDKINSIYQSHRDEFTDTMTDTTETVLSGNLTTTTRIFSLRGCHLLAMFSKTPVAKEFRRWVLDLIEQQNQTVHSPSSAKAAPSLSCSDLAGASTTSTLRQELAALASETATDADMQDMRNLVAALMNNIIDGRVKTSTAIWSMKTTCSETGWPRLKRRLPDALSAC